MACVTVSLTSRTRIMGLGERFLLPWTGQGDANNAQSTSCPAPRGPVVARRGFDKWVLGKKVLKPGFRGTWKLGVF